MTQSCASYILGILAVFGYAEHISGTLICISTHCHDGLSTLSRSLASYWACTRFVSDASEEWNQVHKWIKDGAGFAGRSGCAGYGLVYGRAILYILDQ